MPFIAILKEAEDHLGEFEAVAADIKTAALDGLTKLKAHRDAVVAAVESAVASGERAVSSIKATVEAVAEDGDAAVKSTTQGAQAEIDQFLGKGV